MGKDELVQALEAMLFASGKPVGSGILSDILGVTVDEIKVAAEELKNKLPKKKIFKINSLLYNIESQSKELIISLDCSYNDVNNALSIIVNENINHNNLTKEVALTLFQFVQKANIEKLYLIVALKNPNYILLLQEMMTLGFQSEKSVRSINIDGDAYKILYVETKDMSNNIEEFGL